MQESLFNYSIMKVLGEGGMSRVYLGYDPITHQKVAIKELLPNLAHSKDLRERFRREAQIMAKLDHPNIVKLIRYEESATSFYLIMEYVDGMDLEQHIKEVTGPISEPKTIEIMSTLLDAFGYAHEKGVVHRDIKPANIIITRDGKVKVLDFGIAKIVDENASGRTQTGTRIGTVAYMSPEQVNAASNIDLRTDIYSLGVMLHQMITGKAAYDSSTSSDFEVQTLIVKEPLPRANSIYPYASGHLQKLIDKATQKKRENRFQDCDQFKLALFINTKEPVKQPVKQPHTAGTPWSYVLWSLIALTVLFSIVAIINKSNIQSSNTEESEINSKQTGQINMQIFGGNATYDGEIENQVANGYGTFTVIDGDSKGIVYTGDLLNGSCTGKGKMTWADGNIYEGDFVNNSLTGDGIFTWADGNIYKGAFVNSSRTGKGKLKWANGDIYEGNFINDNRTGEGIYTSANGDKYEGDHVNGSKTGKGTMTYANGDRYKGYWVDDNFNGKGTYTWPSGEKYEGDWVNHNRHGYGTTTFKDSKTEFGKWKNDKQIY